MTAFENQRAAGAQMQEPETTWLSQGRERAWSVWLDQGSDGKWQQIRWEKEAEDDPGAKTLGANPVYMEELWEFIFPKISLWH